MNILIICSGTKENFNFERDRVFIFEQVQVIRIKHDVDFEYFFIKDKGIIGYLKSYFKLRKLLKKKNFDLIHAHYGYSGFVAALQVGVKKVITFHGTDINHSESNVISSIAGLFSDWNIFVSKKLNRKILFNFKNYSIIPCGISLNRFEIINKGKAKNELKLDKSKKYILFSSSFEKKVKNYPLAQEAVLLLDQNVELLELNGYDRREVNLLLNACDVLLMTSYSEGSPQIIKEGMACGIPIVSTDVGEVGSIFGNIEGCLLCEFDAQDVANKLNMALKFKGRTKGRKIAMKFDNKFIAKEIYNVYQNI